MNFNRNYVGITGYNAAGKGAVAEFFMRNGYTFISLSDLLREEAARLKLEPTRENLTNLGKEMRKKSTPGFLAELAILRMENNKKYIIDSIRHPDEINILRSHFKDFFLFGVDAPIALRFDRSQTRGRQENANTLEEFISRENKEKKNNPNSQQLHKCMEMCDELLMNDGSIEDLEKKIVTTLNSNSNTI